MRVLYISNANAMAGASLALLHIVREMRKRGHETLVVTPADKGPLPAKLNEVGCPCIQINMRGNFYPTNPNPIFYLPRLFLMLFLNFRASIKIKKIIRGYQPDIVHTNVGPVNVAVDTCLRMQIPHVWHQREYIDIGLGYHIFPTHQSFLRQSHRKGNYNICITRGVFEHSDFREGIDRVIYDGVFTKASSFPAHIKEKQKYILFVGRIHPSKGTLDVIRVFCRFSRKYPQYKLLIAGSFNRQNKYVAECFEMVENNNMQQKISFLGERTDVYELMAKAAMLVVSSPFEGFGFITAEAMLNYCPVVGRNTAGTKEQFDHGLKITGKEIGFRFLNDEEMFDAMCKAVETDCTDMCIRAHDVVVSSYTVEHNVGQIENYYNFVMKDFKHNKKVFK